MRSLIGREWVAGKPGFPGAVARSPASLPGLILSPELVNDGLLLLGEAGAPKVASHELRFPGREGELCAGQTLEEFDPGYILRIVLLAQIARPAGTFPARREERPK